MTVVTMPGMWQALGRTRKPKAEPFQDWLNEECLPEIRRTGSYQSKNEPGHVDRPDQIAGVLDRLVDEAEDTAAKARRLKTAADKMQQTSERIFLSLPGDGASEDPSDVQITEGQTMHQLSESSETGDSGGRRHLMLRRPLVVFDLETTGLDTDGDMITQVAMYRRVPGENGYPEADGSLVTYVNPQIRIPAKITKITGVSNSDVRGAPTFADLMPKITELIKDADFMGYNAASFDVPFLHSMYKRNGVIMPGPTNRLTLDPLLIERAMRSNKLSDVYRRYTGQPLTDAHDADADIKATIEVLNYQLRALPQSRAATVDDISAWARGRFIDDGQWLRKDGDDVLVCKGEFIGKTLKEVASIAPNYVDWMRNRLSLKRHIDTYLAE